jgi:hypothetical protein
MASVLFFGPYSFNLPSPLQPGQEFVPFWGPWTFPNFRNGTVTVSAHLEVDFPFPATQRITVVGTTSRRDDSSGADVFPYIEAVVRNTGDQPFSFFYAYISLVQA